MKRLSLQWRITLMSVLLIGITCVAMNLLLCSSGVYYMDTIADSLQGGGTVILNDGGAASFDPQLIAPNEELTIVVDGVQGHFRTTNWYITAAVTLLSGILAYFVSGRALKPLRSFTSQVEQVQLNNLADMRIDEDAISEFRQLSRSFNQMLERLNNAFSAQRQFTGNAAHELRTPLALMQAQLELFSAEHPDVRPETAEFLTLLREQTERTGNLRWAFVVDPHLQVEQACSPDRNCTFDSLTFGNPHPHLYDTRKVVIGEQYVNMISDWQPVNTQDNDVHELFKCMGETVLTNAFIIEREDGSVVGYNCRVKRQGNRLEVMPFEKQMIHLHYNLKRPFEVVFNGKTTKTETERGWIN